jgi:hypothetical protein
MLESTLSSLLIGVAGKYAHVSAPDVGVSLSGGRLVLENVRLRADAFNFPSLPFTVVAGRAGRLRVNVPWSALSHAPVTVYIENVHLIAGPRRRSLTTDRRRKREKRSERLRDVARRSKGMREGVESDVDDELRSDRDGDRDGDNRFADTFDTDDDESEYDESSNDDYSDEDEPAQPLLKDGARTKAEIEKATRSKASGTASHDRWHETLLGRLGFNAAIEIFGLKVEYRDKDCISVLSLASCKAHSADRNWLPAFVPLDGGGVAVAMRKVVKLNGLHWVMLPRMAVPRKAERSTELAGATGRKELPKGGNRRADLDAFEARSPILDGIAVTLKVLLCNSEGVESGFHVDLDVELEDPLVHLSARQFSWIDTMLKQGGKPSHIVASGAFHSNTHGREGSSGLMYSPSAEYAEEARNTPTYSDQDRLLEHFDAGSEIISQNERLAPDAVCDHSSENAALGNGSQPVGAIREVASDIKSVEPSDDVSRVGGGRSVESVFAHPQETPSIQRKISSSAQVSGQSSSSNGRLQSLWQAIIGENVDESLDDAAVALGYARNVDVPHPPRTYDADDHDRYHARQAVTEAALAGGYTFRVRVTTPDLTTREALQSLKLELEKERNIRSQLENAEDVVTDAHRKVSTAESEAAALRERNSALVHELQDLERMARSASASKDVMIRQMEAALMRAERQLQAIAQEQVAEQSTGRQEGARRQENAQLPDSGGDEVSRGESSKQRHVGDSGRRRTICGASGSDEATRQTQERRKLASDTGRSHVLSASKAARGRKVVRSSTYFDEQTRGMSDSEKQKLEQVMTLDGLTMV